MVKTKLSCVADFKRNVQSDCMFPSSAGGKGWKTRKKQFIKQNEDTPTFSIGQFIKQNDGTHTLSIGHCELIIFPRFFDCLACCVMGTPMVFDSLACLPQ